MLSDGTVAKSGGKVIKNVAGYDLAKLFAGSFGTLGLIASVSVRLHPLPERDRDRASSASTTRTRCCARVLELARRPLEADCFDVVWERRQGPAPDAVLAARRARRAGRARRRRRRRSTGATCARCSARDGVVLKVSGRPTDLPDVIRAAGRGATVVSRAALGLSWLAFDGPGAQVATVRQALAPRACTVLDGAERVADQWPTTCPARS